MRKVGSDVIMSSQDKLSNFWGQQWSIGAGKDIQVQTKD